MTTRDFEIYNKPAARQQTQESIHPYIEQDLGDADIVDVYPWVEAAFGVPKHRIDEWTSKIGELRWFDDETVQQSLDEFCKAETEPKRYKPFCRLANRIILLARGNLPGVPATNSYPVDSVTFVATSRAVANIQEHGELGANRVLDATLTHGKASGSILRGGQIAWVDVLHTVELKRTNLPLATILADEKKKRKAAGRQPVPAKVRLPLAFLFRVVLTTSRNASFRQTRRKPGLVAVQVYDGKEERLNRTLSPYLELRGSEKTLIYWPDLTLGSNTSTGLTTASPTMLTMTTSAKLSTARCGFGKGKRGRFKLDRMPWNSCPAPTEPAYAAIAQYSRTM